ncbi:BAG family molecular chaperone regulator 4-like [Salvelinus namaycush]|uniref:BAG family molecular chaperone regulator 4-like n=1 Tax=Salvelinus namaycush TaxID=8040 RepID=A0A8U0QAK4_SALNM|nr:BAG family molecular chaperone regulator 4-like [Salvelinus namaycush]
MTNDRSAGDAAWVMHHQMQSNPKSVWPSNFNSENNNVNWNNAMDASQYPGYSSNYWYPQTHSTAGHYPNAYPSGSDVQTPYNPQAMQAYPNGHGIYNTGPGQYPANSFHPSNPFYCAEQMSPRQATGQYPSQGCPGPEQSTGGSGQPHTQHQHQHHHYPGPHCQGAPSYPPGSYTHYGEGGPALPANPQYPTGQALHPRPQAEAWAHSGGYGPSHQQWQPGTQPLHSNYANPVRPQHPPAWPGTGTGAPPPYEAKDQHYPGPHQHQCAPQVGPKPRPAPSPNPTNGKSVDFSSPPQMYNKPGRGGVQEPKPSQGEPPTQPRGPIGPQPLSDNPSLAKVQQVMARVLLLHEDVDEFVGKKSDKSYRYLEELLTKELLVLDSVETQGQEVVRQARKEAVQRIQAILDRLEKKAF